jgi:hypothetical protein
MSCTDEVFGKGTGDHGTRHCGPATIKLVNLHLITPTA